MRATATTAEEPAVVARINVKPRLLVVRLGRVLTRRQVNDFDHPAAVLATCSSDRNGWNPDIAKLRLNGPANGARALMVSRDCQSEVIDLLAHERGLPREKLRLSDRLLQDLGLDGDDAVDFFNNLHERFGTDLTTLHQHWSEHFGPEGFSCLNGLVIIPAAVIGGVVAGFAGLSKFWGVAITVALVAAWLWVMRLWGPPDKMVAITVQQVVAAVEAGAWPSRPQA